MNCKITKCVYTYCMSQNHLTVAEVAETHLGKCTWETPVGKISIDFPQNLFLHLTSAENIMENHETPSYPSLPACFVHFCILLPCQKVKSLDSAWQAEMVGWWLTCGQKMDWLIVSYIWLCDCDWKIHTCSAINLKPLSGLSHSYVSPRTGLKGFPPILW